MSDLWLNLDLWYRLLTRLLDSNFITRFLIQTLYSDLWSRDDVLPLSKYFSLIPGCYCNSLLFVFHIVQMFVFRAIILFGNCSYALSILAKVPAVQDLIHLLMNHTLASDHSSGLVCVNPLDHLELHLDFLLLHCYRKILQYNSSTKKTYWKLLLTSQKSGLAASS